MESGKTYDELIAKYTTNKAEDLEKLRKAYIEGNEEIMQEIEENIQELARKEGWSCIKYNNNVYKLTFIEENNERTYTKVESLTNKLDVTQGRGTFIVKEGDTQDIRVWYPSEVFEDFTITCEDTSVITIDGYNIIAGNVDEDTNITIVLTGKASGNIKNVSVSVAKQLTEISGGGRSR